MSLKVLNTYDVISIFESIYILTDVLDNIIITIYDQVPRICGKKRKIHEMN
jgi:hypothetical protein